MSAADQGAAPSYHGPSLRPPNAWWATFDKALAHSLDLGHGAKFAEDYAIDAAERTHPGGRDAAS